MNDVDIDAELARREQVRKDRMKAIRDAAAPPMVKVTPAKPEYRQHLRHGITGVGWKEGGADAIEWPLDQFTKRRIRDGSVTVEGGELKQLEGAPAQDRRAEPTAAGGQARRADNPTEGTTAERS